MFQSSLTSYDQCNHREATLMSRVDLFQSSLTSYDQCNRLTCGRAPVLLCRLHEREPLSILLSSYHRSLQFIVPSASHALREPHAQHLSTPGSHTTASREWLSLVYSRSFHPFWQVGRPCLSHRKEKSYSKYGNTSPLRRAEQMAPSRTWDQTYVLFLF